ncbi:MAG: hypothetical protein IJY47_00235 [Clostridia bacterium]|nr:hypothetical protein [Clostridia bacterium]
MNHSTKKAWQQYEAGKSYKRRVGLYETIRRNERFYRGDQWQGGEGADLPKPVFNIIRRVMDYLICSVASTNLTIRFTDESLPFLGSREEQESLKSGLELLSANTAYRWEQNSMDNRLMRMLTDAAITGDGVLYCYWDPSLKNPQLFHGDIVTEVIDNVNLFVADVNRADIQSQDYLILAGRAPVSALRAEAAEFGADPEDLKKICADGDSLYQSGEMSRYELEGDDEEKATYIIKFWREGGKVVFEKSTKECTIRRARTDCRLYPVAYFNWIPTKNSFHGTSPITYLIPNQKFINRAYAMAMKHMTDTAFSKVIYDKSKIPEWSNEVGQAIAAVGGGNIADAVSVVGTGEMQSGYMELIESAITMTKEMMGATESALGNIEASNTSAILALQETSRIPLEQIRSGYYRCVEDLANIWADMMCAYYPPERLLPYHTQSGVKTGTLDLTRLKKGFLSAHIDVAEITRYSAINVQNMLDKLLDGGYISPASYVKRLPSGALLDRRGLIEELEQTERTHTNQIEKQEDIINVEFA